MKHKETGCIEVLKYSIKEKRLKRKKIIALLIAVCLFICWLIAINLYMGTIKAIYPDDDSVKDLEAEYIVVLGAKVYKDGRLV